jgi:hypothetical protein
MSGALLGKVDDVTDAASLIRHGRQKWWLTYNAIFTREDGIITLVCERQGVIFYEL